MDSHHYLLTTILQVSADAEVNNATITRVALFSLLPFVVAFSFIVFIFYRQNRESQHRRKQLDLELKALRAQMNPHFMFNCMNSIYHCITSGENEKAGEYLLKFSYLTRRILENSEQKFISLQEDLEMLKAYLDLEQLRTNHLFTYTIDIDPSIDPEAISVVMLLSQPFIENSIWHGFTGQIENPNIKITICSFENKLKYIVEDNGSEKTPTSSGQLPGKRTSKGTQLVFDQLKAIQELEKGEAHFDTITIKKQDGTYGGRRVELYLPLLSLH